MQHNNTPDPIEPIIRKGDYIEYMRLINGGMPIEDISLNNMTEFKLVEDDGKSYRDWGDKITPKSSYKMVFIATHLMEFADSAEYQTGKTEFVVPDQFVEALQNDNIHYITFKKVGKESKYTEKYRLTKIASYRTT